MLLPWCLDTNCWSSNMDERGQTHWCWFRLESRPPSGFRLRASRSTSTRDAIEANSVWPRIWTPRPPCTPSWNTWQRRFWEREKPGHGQTWGLTHTWGPFWTPPLTASFAWRELASDARWLHLCGDGSQKRGDEIPLPFERPMWPPVQPFRRPMSVRSVAGRRSGQDTNPARCVRSVSFATRCWVMKPAGSEPFAALCHLRRVFLRSRVHGASTSRCGRRDLHVSSVWGSWRSISAEGLPRSSLFRRRPAPTRTLRIVVAPCASTPWATFRILMCFGKALGSCGFGPSTSDVKEFTVWPHWCGSDSCRPPSHPKIRPCLS